MPVRKKLIEIKGRIPKGLVQYRYIGGVAIIPNLEKRMKEVDGGDFYHGPFRYTDECMEEISSRSPQSAVAFRTCRGYHMAYDENGSQIKLWIVQYLRKVNETNKNNNV